MILLAAVVAAAVLACGGAPEAATPAATAAKPTAAAVVAKPKPLQVALLTNGPITDSGFNQAHADAMKQVEQKFGDRVAVRVIGSVPETGDAERIMQRLIDNKVDLIIAASFGYQDTSVKLAATNGKVKFLQAWGFKPAPNLGTYSSQMYEAWYVQGIIAGRMTKSNRLGIVAAHPIPPMKWQINAFVRGARSVNPNVRARVAYINHWFDPGLAAAAADALISQRCDVITGVLDNSVAVAQTAQKRKTYLIGHNTDLSKFAPDVTLSGTQWVWGQLYIDAIDRIGQNAWNSQQDLHGGFGKGYVAVTGFGPMVPASVRKEAETAIARFADGSLSVYTGPIRDNKGKTVVAAGKTLTHGEIMGIDWLVEGVR
ncbi:MAG TPA: BMP family ABC transporter substrate-binding protein [Thermoanaerobaculia bacterium]